MSPSWPSRTIGTTCSAVTASSGCTSASSWWRRIAPTGSNPRLLGFIIGEVRAWEFGSTPCGWVFALSVDPDARLHGAGRALLEAMSAEFKKAGVGKMRTMVERNTMLQMLFFRSEGMMAGPYIQLEKDLD